MKALIPFLLALAACDSGVKGELAAIRQEMAELKKINQPKLEAVDAMDDLAREVKKLREKTQPPPPPPLPEPAIAPIPAATGGGLMGGVGGTQQSVNDLYWVLARLAIEGQERTVLALYQATPNGRGFKLAGVRQLSADLQIIEYGQDRPHVKEVMEELKRAKK